MFENQHYGKFVLKLVYIIQNSQDFHKIVIVNPPPGIMDIMDKC